MLKTPKVIYSQWLEKQRRILRKYLLLKGGTFETADISSAVLVSSVCHNLKYLKNRLDGALVVDSDYCLTKSEGVCRMLNSAKDQVASMLSIFEKCVHNIPYVIEAGWGRLLASYACVLTAGNKVRSGMAGNKSNVILSPLWASGSVVRRSMVRIVKVACGSKDSDGAFALSAQPLRMTENVRINGLVKVVICNGGVIC